MSKPPPGSSARWSDPARRRVRTLYVLAAASLAALVPLILFAGFWIKSELDRGQRDLDFFLSAQANTLSQRIDGDIQQQLRALQALAALPALDQSEPSFEDAARRITAALNHWIGLSLLDAETGATLASTAEDAGEPPGPDFLRKVSEGRRAQIESRVSPTSRTILLGFPVIRDGRAERILVTRFDAQDLQDIVSEQARASNLTFALLDTSGRLLAAEPAAQGGIGGAAQPQVAALLGAEKVTTRQSVSGEGEPAWSAAVRSDLTGWTAAASISGRQVERLSNRSLRATVAAGAISLILAGILAAFIIHSVMERRFSEERIAASRALGDLDARLLAATRDALDEQRKASSEREVLLREIYHRVKNNLQIVQSLLRLGSRDLKPEQREPFESAVRRIGAMARVHTLLYNSPDLASIDFRDYLEELLKELSEGFAAEERSIQAALEAHPMRMPLDTAVPLAFIAVEILTNSFKHAFPDGRAGRITVEVRREDENAVLLIRDDGIGIPPEAAGKRRLGLTIVRKLVGQIGGTLEEPEPGASTFVVRFPLGGSEGGGGAASLPRVVEGATSPS